jgi:colanic acid biosynthesis glycosyl transferase WcaI
MIGDGAELARLKRIASDAGMRHVEFTGALPRDEAQRRIAAADVGIVPALPGLYDVAFPSKIMSYLVAGLPVLVLADADSSIARFLNKHGFGTTASPTNVNDAADAIAALVARIDTYDRPRLARSAAHVFSKETYFSAYGQVVARCISKESRFHDLHKRSA